MDIETYVYLMEKVLCVDEGNIKKRIHILDKKEYVYMELSDDDACEIRDLASDELQIVGFDSNYELTKDGNIIEKIIDLFYC